MAETAAFFRVVWTGTLNVRARPSLDAAIVDHKNHGDIVYGTQIDGWIKASEDYWILMVSEAGNGALAEELGVTHMSRLTAHTARWLWSHHYHAAPTFLSGDLAGRSVETDGLGTGALLPPMWWELDVHRAWPLFSRQSIAAIIISLQHLQPGVRVLEQLFCVVAPLLLVHDAVSLGDSTERSCDPEYLERVHDRWYDRERLTLTIETDAGKASRDLFLGPWHTDKPTLAFDEHVSDACFTRSAVDYCHRKMCSPKHWPVEYGESGLHAIIGHRKETKWPPCDHRGLILPSNELPTKWVSVFRGYLNVRERPTMHSASLGTLGANETVECLEEAQGEEGEGWIKIVNPRDPATGDYKFRTTADHCFMLLVSQRGNGPLLLPCWDHCSVPESCSVESPVE